MDKKCIDFNTDKRKNVSSFEKDFFKPMNKVVYGKTMENLREKVKVRLVDNAKDCKKYVKKPNVFSRRHLAKILLLFMKLNQF